MAALQLIDLLDEDLRPPAEHIPLRLFLLCVIGCIVVLGVLSFAQSSEREELQSMHTALRTQLSELKTASARIEPRDNATQAATLERELEQQRIARRAQQNMLDLAGNAPNSRAGFSRYLRELAEYDPRGLWLNSFVLELPESRVRLYGHTEDAELVPVFLENLASSDVFAGTRFDRFEVAAESGSDDPLKFAVFAN